MQRRDRRTGRIDGLALAALVLGGRGEARLAEDLSAALDARLAEIAMHPSRDAAIEALARSAAGPPLDALPSSSRIAALLAPLATAHARARAEALPVPRRGYRPPSGLREHLRRLAVRADHAELAREERASAGGRPWPACSARAPR